MFKKALLHFLIVVAGLILGATMGFAGVYLHGHWSWNRRTSTEAVRLRRYVPYLSRLGIIRSYIITGNVPGDFRKTLLDFSSELSDMKRSPEVGELQPAVSINLGLTYLLLARLERETGHDEQVTALMTKAQMEFQSIGWKDVSDTALNAALDREVKVWQCCNREKAGP